MPRHPGVVGAYVAVAILGAVGFGLSPTALAFERKVPYTGPALASATFLCKASQLAAAGFWRSPTAGTVDEMARVEQEPQATFWRVAIREGIAEVVRFNANLEELGPPTVFAAERTPTGGVLLVRLNRARGESPEAMSIDPTNSSFVYSSQHVNVFYNRANI